jgi:signal transduction histidine kinase
MSGGVYRYDGSQARPLALAPTNPLHEVTSLAEEPAGTLWIGTLSGLYRYDGNMSTNLYQREQEAARLMQLKARSDTLLPGLAHRRVNSIAADGSGGIWIATEGALYHEREGRFRAYTKSDGLPGNTFRSVIRARHGDIWVTSPGGVGRLHEGRWTNYLCGEGISDVFPHIVYEDSAGTIWVTTDGGGINRFKDGHWRVFTIHDGLDDNFISGVTEDTLDNLWMASPNGIMRIPLKQFDDQEAGRRAVLQPRIFNRSDGLPSAEVNQMGFPNAYQTRDGRLLFATDRGVAVIQPGNLKIGGTWLPTYIERFMVNGDNVKFTGHVVVSPGNNDIQIYYTAISLLAPEKIRFKIRLEPLDHDWVDSGVRRDVHYAKLPPGHYNFRVIACNSDGAWNETGATQAFIVQPFFYQTGWFTGLMLLIAGGMVFAFYRTHKLQLAKESAEAAVSAKNEFIMALKQAELERESLHKQLLETSRLAGMSEVASNVLHNVGNVLNSVNVSATLVAELTRNSRVTKLGKAVGLLEEHAGDLASFLSSDPKGVQLRGYLKQLSQHLVDEQQISIAELDSLRKNIEHIKEIVTMQQNYAKVSGLTQVVNVAELVEDSLRMNDGALQRHQIQLVREYQEVPAITVEKHKVLQILVNLIRNAKYACEEGGLADKRVTVRITNGDGGIKISVADNGIGIPPENLTRIFNHGFTTRKGGHGFGLHSGALAAREMGGVLTVQSNGRGQGAVFTLNLPLQPSATAP